MQNLHQPGSMMLVGFGHVFNLHQSGSMTYVSSNYPSTLINTKMPQLKSALHKIYHYDGSRKPLLSPNSTRVKEAKHLVLHHTRYTTFVCVKQSFPYPHKYPNSTKTLRTKSTLAKIYDLAISRTTLPLPLKQPGVHGCRGATKQNKDIWSSFI